MFLSLWSKNSQLAFKLRNHKSTFPLTAKLLKDNLWDLICVWGGARVSESLRLKHCRWSRVLRYQLGVLIHLRVNGKSQALDQI